MLKLPTWATTVLGLLAGVAAILNETTFHLPAQIHGGLAIGLVFLAGIGISPLVGASFRAALHLSQSVSVLLSSGLGALALAIHTLNVSEGLRGVLQGVLTFAAAIGFAPSVNEVDLKAELDQSTKAAIASGAHKA